MRPLEALVRAGHEIVLVVTQPDRRRGRGAATMPSPVRRAAGILGLPVRTPGSAGEVTDELAAIRPDLGVVVAFGQLLSERLLSTAGSVFVNLHFSLLPRWRGAAPVERAILAGDVETGVCLMQVVKELDAGDVFASARVPIAPTDSAGALHERLVEAGTDLLVTTLPALPSMTPHPQVGEVTYAHKLTVEEFRLQPGSPAQDLARLVRAGNPKPGAWLMAAGRRVKVLAAHAIPSATQPIDASRDNPGALDRAHGALVTADGLLVLDEVQPQGKQPMPGAAWFSGLRFDAIDDVVPDGVVDPTGAAATGP